jgi:phosphoribosyl 1,2-cyclic phosphodiesterase
MRVAVLGSGSKGNCLVVESGDTAIMIDAGFAPRETRRRLRDVDAGFDWRKLRGLLLTHAHGDHVKGARQLAGALGIPTYCTPGTQRFAASFTSLANVEVIDPAAPFQVGCLRIRPTKTVHDEPGSVCYAIDDGDEAFAICTDLGEVNEAVAAGLRDVDTLMLEFNHDARMLREGPYSAHLKRRIASRYGHLCNDRARTLLGMSLGPRTSRVLLAHLSEVNNTDALALAAARSVVGSQDVDVAVAPQHHPTSWLRVRFRKRSGQELGGNIAAQWQQQAQDAAVVEAPRQEVAAQAPAQQASLRSVMLERQLALFASKPVRSDA